MKPMIFPARPSTPPKIPIIAAKGHNRHPIPITSYVKKYTSIIWENQKDQH
jgi:hypothetical protein